MLGLSVFGIYLAGFFYFCVIIEVASFVFNFGIYMAKNALGLIKFLAVSEFQMRALMVHALRYPICGSETAINFNFPLSGY